MSRGIQAPSAGALARAPAAEGESKAAAFARLIGSSIGALRRDRGFTEAQFKQFQKEKLAELLLYAQQHVPYYAECIDEVDPEQPDLLAVPPSTKVDLMDNFDDTIADGILTIDEVRRYVDEPGSAGIPYQDRYVLSTTSGTTGLVGYFVQDRYSWELTRGVLMARVLRHRLTPYHISRFSFGRRFRMGFVVATGGPYITYLLTQGIPSAAGLIATTHLFSVMNSVDETVKQLHQVKPHFLHGYPTFIEALGHEKLRGRLEWSPEVISLGSEQFTHVARKVLNEAFPDAYITQTYGMTECLAIANQCKQGRMHVNEDFVVLEAVDALGEPVPVGKASAKVYVTNLWNRVQPVIRYEVSDSVTFTGEQCECGIQLPVIEINGRADDVIWLEDRRGEYHPHPPIPFEVLFLQVPGLRQYQLVHESQNSLKVNFNLQEGADPQDVGTQLRQRFEAYLARNYLTGMVNLELERTPVIERSRRSKKLRQIVSRVPPPPGRVPSAKNGS